MIPKRLNAFRAFMEEHNLHAFIIPSSDPHLSEYPASHWASREWISGFTGSAGTVVITREKAGLWTDSRYFLQAEQELKNSGIDLYKEGLPSTPNYTDWLLSELKNGENVGIDGKVFSSREALSLKDKLKTEGIGFSTEFDPFANIWNDRPQIPTNPIFTLPNEFSGKSANAKIEDIRNFLSSKRLDSIIIASLDAIAWLFNIRGNDVKCNPVAVAYAYVSQSEAVLFINPEKVSLEVRNELKKEGVTFGEYDKIFDFISILADKRTCITSSKLSFALYSAIPQTCMITDMPSPVDLMKSQKNDIEIQGFHNAMTRDGVALVQFLMWLENSITTENLTEIDIVNKLIEYRSKQAYFVGESFDTIAGYAGNGAIVHYHVNPENPASLKPKGLVLIDSGAQYFDGTTDITRTIALGELSDEMKTDYTLVLKGHIALAMAKFPQGTRGSQLDILARQFLWNNGLNYLHGTGHGIGHFLNVHEGPQSIRMDENPTTLEVGMITSNEPGLYRANKHGIRIENLILTQLDSSNDEFGDFYSFETLTLCPIDTTPIAKDLLTAKEREWLNSYHKTVYEKLSPSLSDKEKIWLKDKTKEI